MPRGKPISLDTVRAMHRAHLAGERWVDIAKRFLGAEKGHVARNACTQRGFAVRLTPGGGRFAAYTPATAEEIEQAIQSCTKLRIPDALRNDWRDWTLAQKADVVARMKAVIGWRDPRPQGEFSDGVTPWEFGTPAAHEIADLANTGKPSQQHIFQIRLRAVGVIFEGQLYHWNTGTGAYECSRALHGDQQLSLHRMIWERHYGPVSSGQVVRHIDGNKNNFDISNLTLMDRNAVARENQAAHLLRKGRAMTDALLRRHTTSK